MPLESKQHDEDQAARPANIKLLASLANIFSLESATESKMTFPLPYREDMKSYSHLSKEEEAERLDLAVDITKTVSALCNAHNLLKDKANINPESNVLLRTITRATQIAEKQLAAAQAEKQTAQENATLLENAQELSIQKKDTIEEDICGALDYSDGDIEGAIALVRKDKQTSTNKEPLLLARKEAAIRRQEIKKTIKKLEGQHGGLQKAEAQKRVQNNLGLKADRLRKYKREALIAKSKLEEIIAKIGPDYRHHHQDLGPQQIQQYINEAELEKNGTIASLEKNIKAIRAQNPNIELIAAKIQRLKDKTDAEILRDEAAAQQHKIVEISTQYRYLTALQKQTASLPGANSADDTQAQAITNALSCLSMIRLDPSNLSLTKLSSALGNTVTATRENKSYLALQAILGKWLQNKSKLDQTKLTDYILTDHTNTLIRSHKALLKELQGFIKHCERPKKSGESTNWQSHATNNAQYKKGVDNFLTELSKPNSSLTEALAQNLNTFNEHSREKHIKLQKFFTKTPVRARILVGFLFALALLPGLIALIVYGVAMSNTQRYQKAKKLQKLAEKAENQNPIYNPVSASSQSNLSILNQGTRRPSSGSSLHSNTSTQDPVGTGSPEGSESDQDCDPSAGRVAEKSASNRAVCGPS